MYTKYQFRHSGVIASQTSRHPTFRISNIIKSFIRLWPFRLLLIIFVLLVSFGCKSSNIEGDITRPRKLPSLTLRKTLHLLKHTGPQAFNQVNLAIDKRLISRHTYVKSSQESNLNRKRSCPFNLVPYSIRCLSCVYLMEVVRGSR